MDTAARFALRYTETAAEAVSPPSPERERTLAVRATYLLSEDGRKASLLSGGNGCAVQEVSFTVPANRLHLVAVDGNGVAHLKLRPRFELDAQQRIVRKDHLPTYDVPPTLDELFRAAARNHQLEHGYQAERTAAQTKRRELEYDLRTQVAQAFLRDPSRRALQHPTPTRAYCFLVTEHRRHLRFDVSLDEGIARDVPGEAYRRFTADVRARRAGGRRQHTTNLAAYDEKTGFVAEWVATHGTQDQRVRHAAGVLPLEEVRRTLADEAFAPFNDRPVYVRDGAARLQTHLRQSPPYADAVVTFASLAVFSSDAGAVTTAQWNLLQDFRAVVADADVRLRAHKLALKQHPDAPTLTLFAVRVTRKVGPFVLQREYAAPDA
jgi:hypothetical protein